MPSNKKNDKKNTLNIDHVEIKSVFCNIFLGVII